MSFSGGGDMRGEKARTGERLVAARGICILASLLAALSGCRAVIGAFTPEGRDPQAARTLHGTWCSLGTSITWYNDHVSASGGRFTAGYQSCVRQTLAFDGFVNGGIDGGALANQLGQVARADYYTIEHGVNDWGHSTPVGTMEDYLNNTSNGTFYADYRRLIDEIRTLSPKATIIVCTPRRAFGFRGYLPEHWYLPKNGIKLEDYAKAVRAIAAEEGFEVADFFRNCGSNAGRLKATSIDVALHPNDVGHREMADELLRAFARVD